MNKTGIELICNHVDECTEKKNCEHSKRHMVNHCDVEWPCPIYKDIPVECIDADTAPDNKTLSLLDGVQHKEGV